MRTTYEYCLVVAYLVPLYVVTSVNIDVYIHINGPQ